MKRLSVLFLVLTMGFLIFLSGCNDSNDLPKIEGHITITPYKTSVTVKTSFVDTEEHDLYYDKVRTYVTISSTGEEAKEIQRKDVNVIKPAIDDTKDDEDTEDKEVYIERALKGTNLDFTGLTADTTYELKLIISASGVQKTLETKQVKTINNGESEEDPILVNDLESLLAMNKERTAYYKLTADIDCGNQTIAEIFTSSSVFTGKFDGNGHTISNFGLTGNNYTGLFGYMQGATVKDLNIEGVTYNYTRSDTYLGALTGYADRCTISNVNVKDITFSHGGQTTRNAWIGSLVGSAVNSTIENCSATNVSLTVTRAQLRIYIGGFIGENNKTTIKNCSVEGKMNVTLAYPSNTDGCLYLGGFAGVNDSDRGIESCYSKVNITVNEPESVTSSGYRTHHAYIGGFVGGNIHNVCKISDSVAIGDITIKIQYSYNVYVGGFVGILNNENISRLTNCLYLPVETGVKVELAEIEDSDEDAEETPNEDEETPDEDKEDEPSQTSYISLTIGNVNYDKSKIENVIVYYEWLEIVNIVSKTNQTEYVVSKNIDAFSAKIQQVILSMLE